MRWLNSMRPIQPSPISISLFTMKPVSLGPNQKLIALTIKATNRPPYRLAVLVDKIIGEGLLSRTRPNPSQCLDRKTKNPYGLSAHHISALPGLPEYAIFSRDPD
jgi:hypothetical protein